MTEYAIKAYPTEYRGRTYRSRLEARWAAFFDLLRWKHEYEPFDLGKWSPDFLLTDMNVLVEVKPITDLCEATFGRMRDACEERGILHDTNGRDGISSLVLLGVSPLKGSIIGWLGTNPYFEPDICIVGWIPGRHVPTFKPAIVHCENAGWFTACGNAGGWELHEDPPHGYPDHVMELWARATGLVQWRPE